MKGFSAFLDMRRYKDWDHEISSWHYLSEDLFHQFSWSTECLPLHPEPLSGHVKGQQLQQHRMQSTQRKLANVLGNHQFGADKGMSHWTPCMALQQKFFCSKLWHFGLFGLAVHQAHKLALRASLCQHFPALSWKSSYIFSLSMDF